MENSTTKIKELSNFAWESNQTQFIQNRMIEKFQKVSKRLVNSIQHKSIPEKCQVFGRTMYLQKRGQQFWELANYGIWEKETTEYFLENIPKKGVVLDIGANIGYFTLLFASLVGKEGKVFSFEPEQSNFSILKKNIQTNNFQNVKIENVAVTNYTGKTELYLSEKAAGHHRIYKSNNVSSNHISVRTINLDEYLKETPFFERISFVKLDVEGSEFGAIKGMEKILLQNKKIELVVEFSPKQIRDYGSEPIDQLNYLKALGFNFYAIGSKKKQTKLRDMREIVKKFEGTSENLLCKRS